MKLAPGYLLVLEQHCNHIAGPGRGVKAAYGEEAQAGQGSRHALNYSGRTGCDA